MTNDDLKNRFTYHKPDEQKVHQHETIRTVLLHAAEEILVETPESREQSLAITHLEEAMFWANAAIARYSKYGEKISG